MLSLRSKVLGATSAWRRAPADGDQRRAMAMTLMALFGAGAILSLVALPWTTYLAASHRIGIVSLCLTAGMAALLLGRRGPRLPIWAFPLLAALGTVIISLGTYLASSRPTASEMFYLWVALYASFYFRPRAAALQIGFVGICYGLALALGSESGSAPARWIITMGTLSMTAVIFGFIKGLLDRRLAEKEVTERGLEAEISLQRATLDSTTDGILVVDREGKIATFNRQFQQMWRIPDEVLESGDDDRAISFVLGQLADPDQFVQKVRQLYGRPDAESFDTLRFKDGRVFERYSRPQRGPDRRSHGRVWSFRDVTERERSESRLRHLADHDPLTGLLNRRRFEEEIAERVAYTARYGSDGAVLLLDLDNFKYVNDNLGHRTGDAVIRSIADLLQSRLRETDVLARLGGDELAILLPEADREAAVKVAEALLDAVRDHRAMFGGNHLRMTTSIGVATISGAREQTAEELLVEADIAMYRAKEEGRDRFSVFAAPQPAAASRGNASPPSERIREALEGEGFVLYAQPILDLRTSETSQYELLLRMVTDNGTVLAPGAFLPGAERSGLIQEIDGWVTHQAIALIDRHTRAGQRLRLEVNLSDRTLCDSALPAAIERELASVRIDPGDLIFEVTETAAVVNMDDAKEFAGALAGLGCRFALDDFGAGFGSFYYLKHLPLDYLKIDGDFISNLRHNRTDQAVVNAIVDLSRRLGKATIAEFVPDDDSIDLLRGYGVDYAQGFHVGRPRPVTELWDELGQPVPARA